MPMTRARKKDEVADLRARFEGSELVVVTHNTGLTSREMVEFRAKLRENGAGFKTTKNTLAKIALKGTRFEGMADKFAGPTGIATSADPVVAAKVAQDYAKEHPKLVIVGGALGETMLDAKGVEQLASMPSLDELRGKLVGLLVAPATKVARVLQAPAQQMVGVTKAYSEK